MAKIVSKRMSMSLDGFIAGQQDGVDELFGWYGNGDVGVAAPTRSMTFRVSAASAEHLRPLFDRRGRRPDRGPAHVRLYAGLGRAPPGRRTGLLVSHSVPEGWPREDSPTTFYDGRVRAAGRREAGAGNRIVAVATPSLTRQYLDAGLLDEIVVSLVPVLLGAGIPFFAGPVDGTGSAGGPAVIEGTGRHTPDLPGPPMTPRASGPN